MRTTVMGRHTRDRWSARVARISRDPACQRVPTQPRARIRPAQPDRPPPRCVPAAALRRPLACPDWRDRTGRAEIGAIAIGGQGPNHGGCLSRRLVPRKRRPVPLTRPAPDAEPTGRPGPAGCSDRPSSLSRRVAAGAYTSPVAEISQAAQRSGLPGSRPAATRSTSGCARPSSTTATMPPAPDAGNRCRRPHRGSS